MPEWTDRGRSEGRQNAIRILTELIEVRRGADPTEARLMADEAAANHAGATIGQSLAIAESLLYRLAELTGDSEEQVLKDMLLEIDTPARANDQDVVPPVIAAVKRRIRRAGRSA